MRMNNNPVNVRQLPEDYQDLVAKHFKGKDEISAADVLVALRGDSNFDTKTKGDLQALGNFLNNPSEPAPVKAKETKVLFEITNKSAGAGTSNVGKSVLEFRKLIDQWIKGQDHVKNYFERLITNRLGTEARGEPVELIKLCMGGPSGVGKTSFAEALAQILNNDPNCKPILIPCGDIKNFTDLNKLSGPAPGFIGYSDPTYIESKVSAAGNIPVIIIDELDKAGEDYRNDPDQRKALQQAILEHFNAFLDGKTYTLKNKEYPELSKGVFIVTSNAGYTDPRLLRMNIDEKREHYVNSFWASLQNHIKGRIGRSNVLAFDEIDENTLREVAQETLERSQKELREKASKRNNDIKFLPPDHRLTDFLAKLFHSPTEGVRPFKNAFKTYVLPTLNDTQFVDGGQYQVILNVLPEGQTRGLPGAISEEELKNLCQRIEANHGVLPADVSELPIAVINKAPQPVFGNTGELLTELVGENPGARILGSGNVLAKVGSSKSLQPVQYVVVNKGEFGDVNELCWVTQNKAGTRQFTPVKLPPELETANLDFVCHTIDEKRFLMYATEIPEQGDTGRAYLYLYDADKNPNFKKYQIPDLVRAGSSVGVVRKDDGEFQIVCAGGKEIFKVGDDWSVDLNNMGVDPAVFVLDSSDPGQWRELDAQLARVNCAVTTLNGKVYFIGGEEQTQISVTGNSFPVASNKVTVYDPKDGNFSEGAALTVPTVNPLIIKRQIELGDGNVIEYVEVMGGTSPQINTRENVIEYHPVFGIQTYSSDTGCRLRREKVPALGVSGNLSYLPTMNGGQIGPFVFEDKNTSTEIPVFLPYSNA